jgi:hypothetical protein
MAKTKSKKPTFKSAVVVNAAFERTGESPSNDFSYELQKVSLKGKNVVGEGACGDEMFVCTVDELPELVKFLSDLAKALDEAKS